MSIFKDKVLLITGGTGSFGNMVLNRFLDSDIKEIRIFSRDEKKQDDMRHHLQAQYPERASKVKFYIGDVRNRQSLDVAMRGVDYIFTAAALKQVPSCEFFPMQAVETNIIGTKNMLECAIKHNASRFLFISSVEIYGENRGDVQYFSEEYCGYIDCNTLRAGYTESKRAGEALCQAYIAEKNIDIVIARLPRVYGPTMLMSDTKALSQFIKKGLLKENVVLKSEGNQQFSYLHVSDAVNGILFSLVKGENGNAYNISDEKSNVKLKELANDIASYTGTKVVFELPNEIERKGYSKASIALMDSSKIKELGWDAMYNIHEGLQKTLEILANS